MSNKRYCPRWSPEEDEFLKQNYLSDRNEVLKHIKRTPAGIRHRLNRLGISPGPWRQTPVEPTRKYLRVLERFYKRHIQNLKRFEFMDKVLKAYLEK